MEPQSAGCAVEMNPWVCPQCKGRLALEAGDAKSSLRCARSRLHIYPINDQKIPVFFADRQNRPELGVCRAIDLWLNEHPGENLSESQILGYADFYDRMSPFYDALITSYNVRGNVSEESEIDLLTAFEMVQREPSILLDISCGTGRTIHAALARYPGMVCYGIDCSMGMLRAARQKLPTTSLAQASYTSIPLPDQSVTGVISIHTGFTFCPSPDEMKALAAELYRVLRPSGRAILDSAHRSGVSVLDGTSRHEQYVKTWRAGDEDIFTLHYGKSKEVVLDVLTQIGFNVLTILGSYSADSSFDEGSSRLIAVAEK